MLIHCSFNNLSFLIINKPSSTEQCLLDNHPTELYYQFVAVSTDHPQLYLNRSTSSLAVSLICTWGQLEFVWYFNHNIHDPQLLLCGLYPNPQHQIILLRSYNSPQFWLDLIHPFHVRLLMQRGLIASWAITPIISITLFASSWQRLTQIYLLL